MNTIARAGAALYLVSFVSSLLLLATRGGYVPGYAVMCIGGALVAFHEKQAVRNWSVAMVLVAAILVIVDWSGGYGAPDARSLAKQAYIAELERRVASTMPATPTTNSAGLGILWRDLNNDGVFDELIIREDENRLLRLRRGTYILLDGKWIAAERTANTPAGGLKADNILYLFDGAQGRWLPQ